jgi:segregation and condensation protein B
LDLPQARWSSQSPEHLEPPKHESDDRRRLEAILLMAREPLNARKLAQLALLADATEARTLIRQLNEIYDRDERAMRVEEVAGGFQLLTRPQFAKWLRKQEHIALEERLTEAGQETLALVAYRQPIQRADIEAIRGVGCGEILKQLMERDLVTVVGRSEHLGRPYLYGTTKRFLQLFGLRNLSQLPRSQWVRELDFSTTNPKEATTAIDSPSQPLS